jgi:hypothetical protein
MPAELACSWLQPEAKHLEELYALNLTDTSASYASLDEDLLERCNSLGVETTTQRGANKAPDCIYNCCRSRVA